MVFSGDQLLGGGGANGVKRECKRLDVILIDKAVHVVRFLAFNRRS